MESSGQALRAGLDDPISNDGRGWMDGLGENAWEYLLSAYGIFRRSTDPQCRMDDDLLRPSGTRVGFFRTDSFMGEHPSDVDQLLECSLGRGGAFCAIFFVGYFCGCSEFSCLEIKSTVTT